MAVLLFVLIQIGILGGDTTSQQGIILAAMAMLIYTPLAYMTDNWVYNKNVARASSQPKTLMEARWLTVGPVQENTWIARQDGADKALLIDPGDEPDKILEALEELGTTPEAILITHCHFDHVGAVKAMAEATEGAGLLPGGRGLHPREHQRLRALPGLRAVRVLLARAHGQGRRQAAARRLRRSTSSARPATARTT